MNRRVWATGLGLLLSLAVMAGCSGHAAPGTAPTATDPAPGSTAPAAAPGSTAPAAAPGSAAASAAQQGPLVTTYPVTLTDDEGRKVTIPAEPKRILSLAPSNTELLCALGQGARMVGRTDFDDYPAEAKSVPAVGSLLPPNYEKIVATRPDLVVMIGGNGPEKQKLTDEYKLNILTLQPKDMDGLYHDIELLGIALNAQPQAAKVSADMKAQVKSITDTVAKSSSKPSVFYLLSDEPTIWTAGSGTFLDALVTMAGGMNAAADVSGFKEYSLEKLVAANPDYLISRNPGGLKAKQGWEGLKAVQGGKVVRIEDDNWLTRPGPRLVLGLKWLAETLHPELFTK